MKDTILIAADHGGFALKEKLVAYLTQKGVEVKDLGTFSGQKCDYTDFAYGLAKDISLKRYRRGILICKSGIGNSIVANKLPGVRAALCYGVKAARLSRMHNDSNILVMGATFVPATLAKKITQAWLNTKFQGGRHARRLRKLREIEKRIGRAL